MPDLSVQQTIRDLKDVAAARCEGIFIDSVWEQSATHGSQYYVMAQIVWNPQVDAQAVLNDYYRRAFGPAAASVRKYYETLEMERMKFTAVDVDTRRVVATPATFHLDADWIAEQTHSFVEQARSSGLRIRYVQHDRDGKYGDVFDVTLKKTRAEGIKGPAKAPNTQAYVERFIGSIRSECLNHFILFGLKHLESVLASWISHYLTERPHQGTDIGNELLVLPAGKKKRANSDEEETLSLRDVRCQHRLGGLLKPYERKAA